nr:hypothetical protein [Pseudonocardia bannensis]
MLWHALSILREHRGDGHIALLLDAGLTGLEALITATATGSRTTPTGWASARGRTWGPTTRRDWPSWAGRWCGR